MPFFFWTSKIGDAHHDRAGWMTSVATIRPIFSYSPLLPFAMVYMGLDEEVPNPYC